MPTAVVTGCNSGIGNAFARVLLDEGYKVHATDYVIGDHLHALQRSGAEIAELNVRSMDSIRAFTSALKGQPIDVLLNVAGVMAKHEDDTLTTTTPDVLQRLFETNTFGPMLLTQALLPNILEAQHPRIGIVSSRVGSVGDNSTGGIYAYRASKAAVNSIGKSMAMDLKERGVVVSLLHPGFVKSGLDALTWKREDAVMPEEAATKLWTVMKTKELDQTGMFWHREGYELPW